jgi:phosphoribosylformylglycinamidine (FGAM) synthase-like enzyme
VSKCITMDAKREGSLLYIVGETQAGWGGSLYFKSKGIPGGDVPLLIPTRTRKQYDIAHDAMRKGLVLSAHDC